MTFGRKKEVPHVNTFNMPSTAAPAFKPLTNLDRLKAVRDSKMNEFAKLNFEIAELDSQIGYLERLPMIERIVESLRTH